ncbi:putative inactive purple acid phosphatase 1, partial [Quercus suber]
MRGLNFISLGIFLVLTTLQEVWSHGDQPLSKIAIHKATIDLNHDAYVKASPTVLGLKEQTTEWVTLEYSSPKPSADDWIGVFSPANFNSSTRPQEKPTVHPPQPCSAPIKYQFANYSSPKYKDTGKGYLKLQLINQRSDFSFALFSGGLSNVHSQMSMSAYYPKLVAVSNQVAFTNPNAPVYPHLAQGKQWNEMTVTWTSGYGINEAGAFVEWGPKGGDQVRSPAGTLTSNRNSMCGAPARTVGWRGPVFIHTSFLNELWPNGVYSYKLGHKLFNGTYVWSRQYQFRASPYPGQNSLQRVVIFSDMGKDEADGSNEYNNFQRSSLNTTQELIRDLKNIDLVLHIGDICYANGYISQWDQFTAQYFVLCANWCSILAVVTINMTGQGLDPSMGTWTLGGMWYSTDYGMFHFYIADTEHDEPSNTNEVSFEGPLGRESLQKLWQKYKVDIAVYGHVHNYERTCPIYQILGGMRGLNLLSLAIFLVLTTLQEAWSHGDQPLSKIAIHKATVDLNRNAYIKASPTVLGLKEQTTEWVTLEYGSPKPSADDWIGVFSPANFNASTCPEVNPRVYPPLLCSAPIKYQFANYSSPEYKDTGKGYLKLQLINQRSDFSFALFSGGLSNPKLVAVSNQVAFANPNAPVYPRLAQGKQWNEPKLVAVSNQVAFANPNAPVYPRLAQGKQWNEMTVTWTSGYGINEAGAFVEWGPKGGNQVHSPAGTLTFDRNSMCDAPARTVGWRDPGFIHTSFLKELWPNAVYTYKLGHKLFNGTYVWSQQYQFRASPYPGQNSLQRVVIFGDMGKEGTKQYKFIEHCLASVDRQKQPWLIFLAHRVLGYSSGISYAVEGSFEEPMGRESLQKLWQKYKVDIAVYGHVHNYERTCPIYQ